MGSINIDNTGSGGAITLSSDGTSLLLGGTAVGGGADLYAANESSPSAQPSATGANAIAIGDSATASGPDAFAIGQDTTASGNFATALGSNGDGTGATASGNGGLAIHGSTASGPNSIAIGDSAVSSAVASIAIGGDTDATANYNIALGFGAQALTGTSAVAIGKSRASGEASFAANITNSTSSYGAQNTSGIAIGSLAKAHDSAYAIAIGRNNISSGGSGCTVIGGMNNQAVATSSIITGGAYCSITGSAQYARAGGGYSKASVHGQDVFASGQFSSVGDAQGAKYILRADTTDATATVLTTNNGTPANWNQIVAASDTCITFDGTITAMQNGAQAYASFRIEGLLVNDGGTTTLANSATTVIDNQSSWVMALSADNTNNALAITCTGEASHNIRWVANIRTTEVTYA